MIPNSPRIPPWLLQGTKSSLLAPEGGPNTGLVLKQIASGQAIFIVVWRAIGSVECCDVQPRVFHHDRSSIERVNSAVATAEQHDTCNHDTQSCHRVPLIPSPIDQNRWAHWRNPMDMIRQG
jgi:hypothetical protein